MIIKNTESRIVKDGLVYWLNPSNDNSYPNSGNRVYDLSGTYSYSENFNSPTFDENVFVYNGSNQYTQLPNLSLNFPFHISYWGLERSSDTYGPSILFSNPTVNDKSAGIQVVINNFSVIRIYNYDGSFNAATTPAVTDTYYHICGNFTGSSFDLYINGEYKTSLSGPHSKVWTDTATSYNSCRLNRLSQIYYGGKMGDIQIYDRVLTAEEIQQNYKASAPKYGLHTEREPDYLVIHDKFDGTGYLDGRTPDTVNNGNTWNTGSSTAWSVQSGYAYQTSLDYRAMIDPKTTRYRVEYESYTTSNNQHGIWFRYDGPTSTRSTIFLNSNMTELQTFERVGSSNVGTTLQSGLSGLSGQSLYWTFDVDGQTISYNLSTASGTIASGTTTLLNSIGRVGIFHAGTGISVRSQDFKVYI